MLGSLQYIVKLYDPSDPAIYVDTINEKVYGKASAVKDISFEMVLEFIAGPDIPESLFVAGASILLPEFLCTIKNIWFLPVPSVAISF
jgi:hypothetical protein